MYGLRELGAGIGILSGGRSTGRWLWSRVGGDALDIGTVIKAARLKTGSQRRRVQGALIAVAGITALDLYQALRSRPSGASESERETAAIRI